MSSKSLIHSGNLLYKLKCFAMHLVIVYDGVFHCSQVKKQLILEVAVCDDNLNDNVIYWLRCFNLGPQLVALLGEP